jgi:hypothetical protein
MNNQHIKDYALKAYKEGSSITDLAKEAKEYFDSDLSVEQIRKIISRELNKTKEVSKNWYKTKEAELKEEFEVTVLPKLKLFRTEEKKSKFTTPGTYLLLGCVHVPGHNHAMLEGILKLIPEIKPQGLILMGDFLDLNSLSGHDRGRFTAIKGLTLDQEYKDGNMVLDRLLAELPKEADKVYLYGNHEDRWNRYMSDIQNAKTPLPSPTEALLLKERGFNVFERWSSDYITLGSHLEVLHGQYYNTHCAKQHIDKFRGSVAFVHTHRIQMYVEGKTAGFNIGWGGDVNHPFFNYAERGTKGQWQNGFALVQIDKQGDYFVQQIFVHNNKFYYNGKQY